MTGEGALRPRTGGEILVDTLVRNGTDTVFCAGSDLTSRGDYVTDRGGEYGVIRRQRTKPLIAAVEGIAFGGGFEIVLSCDLVVAANTARFGLPEVCRGLVPTCAALFRAPRSLPLNLAREMILTGAPVEPERLYHAGVVSRITEPGGAVDVVSRAVAGDAGSIVAVEVEHVGNAIVDGKNQLAS